MPELSPALQEAIERGELTREQLRELLEQEARALGLEVEEAIRRARLGTLPHTYIGADIELLAELAA
jgi:hypothetical protein